MYTSMTPVKFVKFFTTGVAEYQTVELVVGDDGKMVHLSDNGQTHEFVDAADAVARSTAEVYLFWDNVPVGVGALAE